MFCPKYVIKLSIWRRLLWRLDFWLLKFGVVRRFRWIYNGSKSAPPSLGDIAGIQPMASKDSLNYRMPTKWQIPR